MRRLSYALAMGLCLAAAPAAAQDAGADAADEADASASEEAGQDAADDAAPAEDDAAPAEDDAAPVDDDAAPADDDAGADAADDEACFSPTQNLDTALEEDAVGCACDPEVDEDACVDGIALTCDEGAWIVAEDPACGAAPSDPDPIPLCSAKVPGRGSGGATASAVVSLLIGLVVALRGRGSRGI